MIAIKQIMTLALVIAGVAAEHVSAPRQSGSLLRNVIGRDDFAAFVESLGLTDGEHARCLETFTAYRRRTAELEEAAQDRLQRIDQVTLQKLRRELMPADDEAILFPDANHDPTVSWAPPDDPRWQALRELEARLYNWRVETNDRNVALLEETFARWQAILDERDGHPVTAAMFFLRHFMDERPRAESEYLFLPVDVDALVRESRTDGVLGNINARAQRGEFDGADIVDLAFDIDAAVAEYRGAFEQYLRRRILKRGSRRRPDEIVFSRVLDESYEPRMRESGRIWLARHEIDRRVVEAIAALLREAVDEESARLWIDEYRARVNRDLFADRWPHGMVRWLGERADASPEQFEAARMLQGQFVEQYAAARDRAFVLGVQACAASGQTLIPLPTEPGTHERYFESVARMHLVSLNAAVSFCALLTDVQRDDLLPAWKPGMPPYWGGGVFGPSLMTQYVSDDLDVRLAEMRRRLVEW